MESKISLSKITLSSNDSWGPDPSFVFEQYRNLPFAPFNKLEKIGKYCDISNPAAAKPIVSTLGSTTVPVDEEEEFKIVETRVLGKTKEKQPYKKKTYPQQTQPTQAAPTVYQNKLYKTSAHQQQQRRRYNPRIQTTRTKFKDNAGIQGDWEYITDANKSNFDKMPVSNVKVADIKTIGAIPEYDKTWSARTNPKKNPPFALPNTISIGTGPRSDRNMLEIIEKERDTQDITIYTTDNILSTLLTMKTSIYPWEIQIVKEGNQIFLEPNEKNKVNYIDILTVNENTAGDLPEDEKDLLKLCIEATNVNRKFIEISTKGTEIKDFSTDKSGSTDAPDRKVYRYRKWTLDNKINVTVRSEVDAFIKEGDGTSFVKVCAFNECQPQLDWKSNIEQNRGAVISSELRNNLCKVCNWLCQAFLSECNQFRFGFVTKPNVKEAKYSVLTVEDMSTTTLSKTVNFGLKDSWSIVKTLADIISKEDDGIFLIAKPAYKQTIRVYRVPEKHDESMES